ncbi:MAG: hypothetical protein ACOYN3_05530 [Acidimicrobiia bacterium]
MIAAPNAAEAVASARTWADVVTANQAGIGLSRAIAPSETVPASRQNDLASAPIRKDPSFVYAPGYVQADADGYVQVPPVDPHAFLDLGAHERGGDGNQAVLRTAQQAYAGAQGLVGAQR